MKRRHGFTRPASVLIAWMLAFALHASASAQPLCLVERYGEADGLAQRHVTQMLQDAQGMMWFSTWNGLCRYDGYEFRTFKAHVGDGSPLSTDRIRSVWPQADGNIGCRVDEDLYVFNLRTYRFEPTKATQPGATAAKAVTPGQPFEFTDGQGVAWTLQSDGRLSYRKRGGTATAYDLQPALEPIRFCLPDRQGHLWAVGENGLYKLSFPKQPACVRRDAAAGEAKALLADSHRRYWVATRNDAAVRIYDSGNALVGFLSPTGEITKAQARFPHSVYSMAQTADGTVWLGLKPGGLLRLRERQGGTAYDVERMAALGDRAVYDMKADRWGRLWVATLDGGVCCITDPAATSPRVLTPAKGLEGYPKDKAQRARALHITKDDMLLVATTEGLLVAKLTDNEALGKILFRCHAREAGRRDALSCSATMNIAEDSDGRVYISTESGGVNRIESRRLDAPQLSFAHYDEASGFPTDIALSIVPFGKRMLVVGSNQLVLLNPKDGSSEDFGSGFFLSDYNFAEAAPIRLPDGRWLLALRDGTCAIHPDALRKSDFVPNIAFTGVSVQGRWLDAPINALDTLVLAKDERSLTLTFAALDYSPEACLRYAFSLSGRGDGEDGGKWNDVGRNHSATLLDLRPGTYTLTVRSTNADGVWVDNARRLTLVVTPRFTETATAQVLFLLLVAALLGGIAYTYIYIRRISRQRREALEAYLSLLNAGKEADAPQPQPVQPRLSTEDDALMRRVSAFVEAHIADADITVGDMAEAAAVSRSGLQRKMKQVTGVTPLDFLREARIKRACHLLATTTMNISEVAYACGFSDPKYFSRTFKASVGKSPTEYRG